MNRTRFTSAKWRRFQVLSVGTVFALALSSCTSEPRKDGFGPNFVTTAVTEGTNNSLAIQTCQIQTVGLELVAAVDSNAGEIRELAKHWQLSAGYDKQLPTKASEYVAVCAYSTSGVPELEKKSKFLAMWVKKDGSWTAVLAGWSPS